MAYDNPCFCFCCGPMKPACIWDFLGVFCCACILVATGCDCQDGNANQGCETCSDGLDS